MTIITSGKRCKAGALLQLQPFVKRHHYACRLRLDLHDALKAECERLNCSQGVFLEVLIEKALAVNLVDAGDVFSYSVQGRWLAEKLRRAPFGVKHSVKQDGVLAK